MGVLYDMVEFIYYPFPHILLTLFGKCLWLSPYNIKHYNDKSDLKNPEIVNTCKEKPEVGHTP